MSEWQTPKTDWSASQEEGVSGADFNRIEILHNHIVDTEGNRYKTVRIGSQVWMADNLRITKYNDGTNIPEVTDNATWNGLTTPAFCKYNNEITKYGHLYNWYVIDPSNTKSITPEGWRVPTDADWGALVDYLIVNGYNWDNSTDILTDFKYGKAVASQQGWITTDTAGRVGNDAWKNNITGLNLLPGGYRNISGTQNFAGIDNEMFYRTSDNSEQGIYMNASIAAFGASGFSKTTGASIRLVSDV